MVLPSSKALDWYSKWAIGQFDFWSSVSDKVKIKIWRKIKFATVDEKKKSESDPKRIPVIHFNPKLRWNQYTDQVIGLLDSIYSTKQVKLMKGNRNNTVSTPIFAWVTWILLFHSTMLRAISSIRLTTAIFFFDCLHSCLFTPTASLDAPLLQPYQLLTSARIGLCYTCKKPSQSLYLIFSSIEATSNFLWMNTFLITSLYVLGLSIQSPS